MKQEANEQVRGLAPERAVATDEDVPALPEAAQLPRNLGQDACAWLDQYIAFSRHWSPRSYEGFHEACGLWLLSTVAARRVVVHFGRERFTNLYIVLCARTSVWAKSSAARIAMKVIESAGLQHLLAPDECTPQALIKMMAGTLPANYDQMSKAELEVLADKLAFAAQRGWFYDEFGQKLSGMMKENGPMSDFRGLLRRFDDCPTRYENATIGRGHEEVSRPYLALLACLTTADLAPYARKNGALWGDGSFARFAFVAPPAHTMHSPRRFPRGECNIPPSLTNPLFKWHERLGLPETEIVRDTDEDGNAVGPRRLAIAPIEPKVVTFGEGVDDALYQYDEALRSITQAHDNTDLDGNYARLSEKALRIAALLASFSNSDVIELRHWARAQEITERWRTSLHTLIATLQQTRTTNPEAEFEDQVVGILNRTEGETANDVRRFLKGRSTDEIKQMLDTLVKHGVLTASDTKKKTKRYHVAGSNRSTGEAETRSGDVSASPVATERSGQGVAVSDTPVLRYSPSSTSIPGTVNNSQLEHAYYLLRTKGPEVAGRYMNAVGGVHAYPHELQQAVIAQQ